MTVEALRRRDPATLDDLLARYGRELQGVAYLILRDRAEAEDVAVETILTAFEKGGSIRDEGAVRAWLLRVATNRALETRRRGGRVVRLHVLPDERPGAQDLAGDAAIRIALLDGVAALPPRQRAAIVLRYYADLPVEGVAAALGTSVNTVKSQLKTALEHLRAGVAQWGEPVREAHHA
jgi:RNA polymerase sigma-70 factor (ECF subfamily)